MDITFHNGSTQLYTRPGFASSSCILSVETAKQRETLVINSRAEYVLVAVQYRDISLLRIYLKVVYTSIGQSNKEVLRQEIHIITSTDRFN